MSTVVVSLSNNGIVDILYASPGVNVVQIDWQDYEAGGQFPEECSDVMFHPEVYNPTYKAAMLGKWNVRGTTLNHADVFKVRYYPTFGESGMWHRFMNRINRELTQAEYHRQYHRQAKDS